MKIASVTVLYQEDQFIIPHFNMISHFDENIVITSKKPFIDYLQSGRVTEDKDNSIEILKNNFPKVHILEHNENYFCGNIFNIGIKKARELNCDVIVKFDPDMFVTKKDMDLLMETINKGDYQTLLLDYPNNTIAYKKDFYHGVPAKIFPVGCDPLIVKTNQLFIQDGVKIKTTGEQKVIDIPNFMVHHFTGFKGNVDEVELKRVESLPGFTKWLSAPLEIMDMFNK